MAYYFVNALFFLIVLLYCYILQYVLQIRRSTIVVQRVLQHVRTLILFGVQDSAYRIVSATKVTYWTNGALASYRMIVSQEYLLNQKSDNNFYIVMFLFFFEKINKN